MLQLLRQYTRSRRLRLFKRFLAHARGPLRIVDLGGTVRFWEDWGLRADDPVDVTLVNNHLVDKTHMDDPIRLPNIHRVCADVLTLTPEEFAKYDLIFSNSLIEHLPGRAAQEKLAAAILASGRPYFIQTPNKRSPLDPHFPRLYVPFFATYPRSLQARLLTWSALGSGSAAPSYEAALTRLEHYHPLTVHDVQQLFPQARVMVERPLGVPMSVVAISRNVGT